MSCWNCLVLYSLALDGGTNGQMEFGLTPAGSATVAVPPGAAGAVEEADGDTPLTDEAGALVHAATPAATPAASTAAAPVTATRPSPDCRLFRNITCAP